MRRAGYLIACVTMASCVLYDSRAEHEQQVDESQPACGMPGQAEDGERCDCTEDCKTQGDDVFCLDEPTTGVPGGTCYHACSADRECRTGFFCRVGVCSAGCTSSEECGPGRACQSFDDSGQKVCTFFCDEDSDCLSGHCNVYMGLCISAEDQIVGKGLGESCAEDGDCASQSCFDRACFSLCDPDKDLCPDQGSCDDGICLPVGE